MSLARYPQSLMITLVHRAGPMQLELLAPDRVIVVSGLVFVGDDSQPVYRQLFAKGYGSVLSILAGDPPVGRTARLARRDVVALGDAIVATRLPRPHIDPVADSSDWGATTGLSGVVDDAPFAFTVSQLGSGYRGRDAHAFSVLVATLLPRAGLEPKEQRWSHLTAER